MKKLVAFSAGSKNGNTETFIKQSLMAAEEMGVKVELIRLRDMEIEPCMLCAGICPAQNDPKKCIHKDDGNFLVEKFLDSDGVIFGAPVYSLTPPGLWFNFRDRVFGPKMDVASKEIFGREPDFARGRFKERPGALISVGGARTEHWVSLGMCNLYTITFSAQVKIVDLMNVTRVAHAGAATMRDDYMERARSLGQNLANAILTGDFSYSKNAPQGLCPSCHLSDVKWKPGEQIVECLVCGIRGKIIEQNGKVSVEWLPDDGEQNRLTVKGKITHLKEIVDEMKNYYEPVKEEALARLEKFKNYNNCIVKSPTKEARRAERRNTSGSEL